MYLLKLLRHNKYELTDKSKTKECEYQLGHCETYLNSNRLKTFYDIDLARRPMKVCVTVCIYVMCQYVNESSITCHKQNLSDLGVIN